MKKNDAGDGYRSRFQALIRRSAIYLQHPPAYKKCSQESPYEFLKNSSS